MENNIFHNIQVKRENFRKYAQKALENNWIDQEKYNEIIYKIEHDKLVVGVIGQMKAGKSTFLNALVFKDEVLPAATTPMTASLSVITYGAEKKLEAEFYTSNEWAELKQFASLNVDDYDSDSNQKSKIKAAKEIVSKSVKIEDELNFLLGSKKSDNFENLIEYVGAEGKYISITKSVRIEYPLDYLKGVEIVDTPGFNDPVVSREERTKDFLSKADVVIMLLYAGRAFDATDKDIIFNKVRTIGVGKLLIGVNKYDINYAQGETEQEMISYVKEQLLKASKEHEANSIARLVKEQDPLLISANMALLSQLDISKINQNENSSFYYKKALEDFEISNQHQMLHKSLMPKFESAIFDMISKSKETILIQKPINYIKQIGENRSNELETLKTQISNELIILNKPDSEIEDLLNSVQKAEKRIIRKINGLETDIEEIIFKSIKKLTNDTEDAIFESKKKCIRIVDDALVYTENLHNKVIAVIEELEIDVKRIFDRHSDAINNKLRNLINDFIFEVDEIVEKYLEDFESQDYLKEIKLFFLKDFVSIIFYDLFEDREEFNSDSNFLDDVFSFVNGLSFGLIGVYGSAVAKVTSGKANEREWIKNFFSMIDLDRISKNIIEAGDKKIVEIQKKLVNDFVHPIVEKTEKLITDKTNKENKINELVIKITQIKDDCEVLKTQQSEMNELEKII